MKKFLLLVLIFTPFMILKAQDSRIDKKNLVLPTGHIVHVCHKTDPDKRGLVYITDSGSTVPIHKELYSWIWGKCYSLEVLYPGDYLVWTNGINEQKEEVTENAFILRAANNKTGEMVVLDKCDLNNYMSLIGLSPDGRRIFYKIINNNHCTLRISDWKGNKTEFPHYREFDAYCRTFWLNNEEILIQEESSLLKWNVRTAAVTTLLEKRDLGALWHSAPSEKILFSIPDGMDGIFDTVTGEIRFFTTQPLDISYYFWSPKGKKLYYITTSKEDRRELYSRDINTGDTRLLASWSNYLYLLGFLMKGRALLFLEEDYNKYEYSHFPLRLLDLETGKWSDFSEKTGYYWYGPTACPHLYFFDGETWDLDSEVLGQSGRKSRKGMDRKSVSRERIVNGELIIRVSENLYEITYLDSVRLLSGDNVIPPKNLPAELTDNDGDYLLLRRGDYVELHYRVPQDLREDLVLEFSGYYEPGN